MALPHAAFWAMRDALDWGVQIVQRRRNCVFLCKYGNLGCSLLEIRSWPLSEVRKAADDVIYWIAQETKNSKAS
jgi:hypothetical protein